MGWWFRRKAPGLVHVTFVNSATGKPFAESDVPAAQLPESFEAQTTMHLPDGDWTVVEARPVTAAEFRASGELVLVLTKCETVMVDPVSVLFSLPTIADDALPPVAPGSSKLGRPVLELHEDDWRQVEWVRAAEADAVARELAAIREVHELERQGIGFRRLHLRRAIPAPLGPTGLPLSHLRAALGPRAEWLEGVAYVGVAGVAADTFAVRLLSSIELYGVAPAGTARTVCFANTRTNNAPQPDVAALARFAADHDLILLDWCRARDVAATEAAYAEFFVAEA